MLSFATAAAFFLAVLLRTAAITLVVWLSALTLHKQCANARRRLWVVTFAALLALPILMCLPRWQLLPTAGRSADSTVLARSPAPAWPSSPAVSAPVSSLAALPHTGQAPTLVAQPAGGWPGSTLVVLWAAVAMMLLVRLARGHWRAQRLRNAARSTDWSERRRRDVGFDRCPVVVSEAVASAFTVGILRSTIVVPTSSKAWDDRRWRAVLTHEAAHVRHRDCLSQLLAQLVVCLYWPNPLIWLAASRLREERELAADDAVLAVDRHGAFDYAQSLIDLARSKARPLSVVALAQPPLQRRIAHILATKVRRSGGRAATLVLAALVAALVFALGCVGPKEERSATGRSSLSSRALDSFVEVDNASPQPLAVSIIKPDGTTIELAKVKQGEVRCLRAGRDRRWRVRDATGQILEEFAGGQDVQRLTITAARTGLAVHSERLPSDTVRSTSGEQLATVRLANHSKHSVKAFWIDYCGREKQWYTVAPSAVYSSRSWASHPWRIKDYRGKTLGTAVADANGLQIDVDASGLHARAMAKRPPRPKNRAPVLYQVSHRAFPAPYGHGLSLHWLPPSDPASQQIEVQFSIGQSDSWISYTKQRASNVPWINHHGHARCRVRSRWRHVAPEHRGIDRRSEPVFEAAKCLEPGQTYTYRVRGLDANGQPVTSWSNTLRATMPNWREDPTIAGAPYSWGRATAEPGLMRSTASDRPAVVRLINDSQRAVQLFWIDGDGFDDHFYLRLEPGDAKTQPSFLGSQWRVRDGDSGRVLGGFENTQATQAVRVSSL